MTFFRKAGLVLTCAPMIALAAPAQAQQPAPPPKGAEILTTKCFQCHTNAMWQDQRQDARAWEETLYRMDGPGAPWTTEEIKLMADYLGTDIGPDATTERPAAP